MKVTWLGQGGFLFDVNGFKIIIDPYLSNSVEKIESQNYRRIAVDDKFLSVKPNLIVLTHNHLDHTDPETLTHYLTSESKVTVLASFNAWKTIREKFKNINKNYVSFNVGSEWTENGILFKAVYAEHSDEYAIGVIISVNGKNYYVTGDTLYSKKVFDSIEDKIDYCFLAVNGKGNNMNFIDGARFAQKLNCVALPMHCGLFDELKLEDFPYENKIILKIYQEMEI
ncbi:MAG: MBL fold metallo-hydrolase [Clostridiales bacterium]|nr:MBL fold metallo-hydrolase [Clostridiales bacterium]